MRFWTGGWGPAQGGEADGIRSLTAGASDAAAADGALAVAEDVAACESPSWLAAHPRLDIIYAALESEGRVAAFRRVGESTLRAWGEPVAVGPLVCHLAVSPAGDSLIASCFGDGSVVRVALSADGALGAASRGAPARDPYPDALADGAGLSGFGGGGILLDSGSGFDGGEHRASGPDAAGGGSANAPGERVSRAHCAVFLPDGRIATTDLGFDLVRIWRRSGNSLLPDGEVVLPRGVGPRHLRSHPSGYLYVITEYSAEVFVLGVDRGGRWYLEGGTATGALPGDAGAEIAQTRDGGFLAVGLRGSDTLAVLRVAGNGERLAPVALVESGVRWPRFHTVIRDTLLVAGQLSHEVASLPLDERTGIPGRVRHRVATPSPTHLLAAR